MELKEYINLKILGRGNKGEITKKVKSNFNQKIYVIKDLGEQQLTDNQKEVLNILQNDKCPFIVKHYPLRKNNNEIMTDFINDVDLQDYLNTYIDLEQHIEEKLLWKLFLQCAASVKYLHEQNIIHRNIRLENFYMTDDKEIKLGNFRYATIMNGVDENINYPEEGILYKSAETLNNNIYNKKSDIFALGVVFYQLCFFQFPYEVLYKSDKDDELKGIYDLKANTEKQTNYSEDLKNLIYQMIEKNEDKRINIGQVYYIVYRKYLECYIQNSCVESVLRCLSSCGIFSDPQVPSLYQFEPNNMEPPITSNLFYICEYFNKNEQEGIKNRNQYIEFINNLRILFEKYLVIKEGEEPKPYDIMKYIIEKYMKESYSQDEQSGEKIYYNIKAESFFKGKLQIAHEFQNNIAYEYQFSFLNINLDNCQKNENTKKYDIIKNDFKDNFRLKYHYLTMPRYIIVAVDRGKNHNISGKDFPTNFIVENIKVKFENQGIENLYNFHYTLIGFLIKTLKNEQEHFISIYQRKKIDQKGNIIIEWLISEDNYIKVLENEKKAIELAEGSIEIVLYKNSHNNPV